MFVVCFVLMASCLPQGFGVAGGPGVIAHDEAAIAQIFGSPHLAPYSANKSNETLTDPDYWDVEGYMPSALNYDKFDWAFGKKIASKTNANTLIAPVSLKLALAILYEAATGSTMDEIQNVLDFPSGRDQVRLKFAAILGSLRTPATKEYILDLGSRILIDSGTQPRQKFSAVAEDNYMTEIKNADFQNPKLAVQETNAWVANLTNNRITDLVTEDDLNGIVMMVLNTIYFKGSWRHQFPLNETRPDRFYMTSTQTVTVPFMSHTAKFFFSESSTLDAKIIRLPYLGKKIAMTIVLPNSLNGIVHLLNEITPAKLIKEQFAMQEMLVDIKIPKLKFEFLAHLESTLKEMGIRQLFQDTASLPGIARGQTLAQRLKVTSIIQKCGIELNEVGSTAYAATEVTLVNKFGSEPNVEFVANRPFIFYIEDESTRQILFMGKVMNPLESIGTYNEPGVQSIVAPAVPVNVP